MHICYVSYEYPPQYGGGIGTYVYNIANALIQKGHKVTVITFNPGNLPAYEVENGVNVYRISITNEELENLNKKPHNQYTLFYWQLYSRKVYHLLKEIHKGMDVVEWPDYRGEGWACFKAKHNKGEFASLPFVVRLHTPLFVLNEYNKKDSAEYQILSSYEIDTMLMADYICSPTRILADIVQRKLNWEPEIEVLPHPLDFNSFPEKVNYDPNSNTLLYVGRLERRKGVETLIKAAVPLLEEKDSLKLKLIGGDTDTGPNNSSMKEHLQKFIPQNLKKRIIFVDRIPREDLLNEYSKACCCVVPSLFENFPNVCLEAMASGVPVIVGSNTGMLEMITEGSSGISFESGNAEDLYDKLKMFFKKTFRERITMAENAYYEVRERFNYSKTVTAQEQYFKKISENHSMEPKNRLDLGKYQKGLVSVVIPCYNHGKYLKDAINTVREQTYKKTEIIVVNDGSTDKYTLDVIKEISNAEPDVIVINQENSGLAAARNAGINKAKGEYILPLDADDLLEKDFLSKTVDILNNHPDVGFVYTWVKYFGAADGIWQTPEYDHVHLLVTNLCTAASLFRHNAFDQVGGYNTDMVYGFEDWDFWIALSKHGWRGWCVKEPLFLYRQHGQGSMLSSSQEYREFLVSKVIEHHLDTYQENLPQVLVKKDKMFYDAHIKAYKLSNELNNIYNSKAWKWATRFRKIKEFFK